MNEGDRSHEGVYLLCGSCPADVLVREESPGRWGGEEYLSGGAIYRPDPIDASDYFPLEVGNSWTYEAVGYWEKWKSFSIPQIATTRVIGTTMIEGKEYFLVEGYFFYWPSDYYPYPDTVLLREEGEKVYWYFEGKEYLYYDFSAPLGGILPEITENYWQIPVFSYDSAIGMIAKSYETLDSMVFTTDCPVEDGWPDIIEESFTRGIGRSYLSIHLQSSLGPIYLLREAVIGGRRYTSPFVDPESYFPLQVGTRWTYRWVYSRMSPEGAERVTTRVVGKTLMDGEESGKGLFFGRGLPEMASV